MNDELNEDGYPTEATLELIRGWKPKATPEGLTYRPLLEYLQQLWYYPEYFKLDEDNKTFRVSTGGWSGNEDLIEALKSNVLAWSLTWISSKRGGHYVFEAG